VVRKKKSRLPGKKVVASATRKKQPSVKQRRLLEHGRNDFTVAQILARVAAKGAYKSRQDVGRT
jgi:hypothetical protein